MIREPLYFPPVSALWQQVRPLLQYGIVAGGAARTIIDGEEHTPPPSDIDLFLCEGEDTSRVFAALRSFDYYMTADNGRGVTTWERLRGLDLPVQVVSASGKFDHFTTEVWALEIDPRVDGAIAVYGDTADADAMARKLVIRRVINPLRQMYRIAKYAAKGYTIDPEEILTLFQAWDAASTLTKAEWKSQVHSDEYVLHTAGRI